MSLHDDPPTYQQFLGLCDRYAAFVKDNLMDEHGRLLEEFSDLKATFPRSTKIQEWTIEKLQILFELLKLRDHDDLKKILSYMEDKRYGWNGLRYILRNRCLREKRHCKDLLGIGNDPDGTNYIFKAAHEIFMDNEYGGIIIYLFGYCLAALFSSRLRLDDLRVPYFLQIACERNSNLYRLIHEIVEICDVNTGMHENCRKTTEYGACDYDYTTVFPTQHTEIVLKDLVCNRDVPVIIDGFENEKFHASMLRDIANIPGKRNTFSIRDRFNILPLFVCPAIKSNFKNVFNMPLTNFDISSEYLELIRKNKQMLASWILELVKNAEEYFEPDNTPVAHIVRSRIGEVRHSFFKNINNHINQIRKNCRHYINLDTKDITNIGFLSYFFSQYVRVLVSSISMNGEVAFKYNKDEKSYNINEIASEMNNGAAASLVKLHSTNSPLLFQNVTIHAKDNLDSIEIKHAKKKGEEYAKNIIKYYQSYGVSIRILPDAEFEKERYIFHVELLAGTDKKLISRYADEVRRLLGLEFFVPDIRHSSIKIIASKNPLQENSLLNMLASEEFGKVRMKIPYAVGYDMLGEMVFADIAEFPHLIIGGATGYGKSSALHSLLMSIVFGTRARRVKLMLIDFGASRLNMFADVPHLLAPVVGMNELIKGDQYITALQEEMERRLNIFEQNEKELDNLPSIVCVIDEFPAFIHGLIANEIIHKRDLYAPLVDLLSRARKVKIHIILAAQDATKDNMKIKLTNLAAAIAFRCRSWRDSMAILDEPDAAKLSGKGSMYFQCYQHEGLLRLQGAYMEPDQIRHHVQNAKFDLSGASDFSLEGLDEREILFDTENVSDSHRTDPQYEEEQVLSKIIVEALSKRKFSNNMVKKTSQMGYTRAENFMKKLEKYGIVEKQRKGAKLARPVIPQHIDDLQVEVVELLKKHGVSDETITDALNKRKSITNISGTSNNSDSEMDLK